jgi:hypothetical protein
MTRATNILCYFAKKSNMLKLLFFLFTLITFVFIVSQGALLDNFNQNIKVLISILAFGILVQIKAEKKSIRHAIGRGIIWAALTTVFIGFLFYLYLLINFPD